MSLGIYKPQQGYWVRVMTAIFAGVLVLATAAWAWQQAQLVRLPKKDWSVSAAQAEGATGVGSRVTFLYDDQVNPPVDLGTAEVIEYTPSAAGRATFKVKNLDKPLKDRIAEANLVRGQGFSATINPPRGNDIFDPVYLQAGFVGVVLVVGAALIYWFVGVRRGTAEFLIATDNEMKKVNWSTRREIVGSTWVVVTATFLLAAMLFFVDLVFQQFFTLIHVLER